MTNKYFENSSGMFRSFILYYLMAQTRGSRFIKS